LDDVRDVIVACGDRPFITIEPGKSLTGNAQIFYTNVGFTFRQTGRYYVSAELDIGDGSGAIVRSESVALVVRAPQTPEEEQIARLSMTVGVGSAFALGDYGTDADAEKNLEELAADYGQTETGMAAALILANAQSRDLRDLYSGDKLRVENKEVAQAHFEKAAEAAVKADPRKLVVLASAVAAPTEARAPVLDLCNDYLDRTAAAAKNGPKVRGRKRKKRGTADAASATSASVNAEALDFLRGVRRTFVGGE
jgi:hypothetical protein